MDSPDYIDRLIYERVFDNAIVGICLMAHRTFERVNRSMEQILEYGPGELDGKSVRQVYAREQDFEEVGRVVAAFPADNRYVHERPLVTKTGQLRWCIISGRLIDPSQPDTRSVWVVQDITEKKQIEDQLQRERDRLEHTIQRRTLNLRKTNAALRAEAELRRASQRAMIESREQYRVLFRNSPSGIVMTDAAGEVVDVNPAVLSFAGVRTLEQFLEVARNSPCTGTDGRALGTLFDLIRTRAAANARRAEREVVQWLRPRGTPLWLEVAAVRLPLRGHGAAIVIYDRTEQRLAREREHAQREQLAHADRVAHMGHLASALAHELGQPLSASLSYAAGLERRLLPLLSDQPEAGAVLHRLQQHLVQAGGILANVRSFIARHKAEDEVFDVAALATVTIDMLAFQNATISVSVSLDRRLVSTRVQGSRIEIQQVFVNLLLNAGEALREAGTAAPRIEVRLGQRSSARIEVAVSDNGPGVPREARDQVFRPYYTTKRGGLGMGLMMCQTIIESHGGSLWLDAKARRGAVFRFLLPQVA